MRLRQGGQGGGGFEKGVISQGASKPKSQHGNKNTTAINEKNNHFDRWPNIQTISI